MYNSLVVTVVTDLVTLKFRLENQNSSQLEMGNSNEKVIVTTVSNENTEEAPKKLKPCCACPETKRARDKCIIEKGEENCGPLIQAHKDCMRKMGFNI